MFSDVCQLSLAPVRTDSLSRLLALCSSRGEQDLLGPRFWRAPLDMIDVVSPCRPHDACGLVGQGGGCRVVPTSGLDRWAPRARSRSGSWCSLTDRNTAQSPCVSNVRR